ncbi:hypothetical protein INR49_018794 [Caranx melampygus]|nr:hypothetical protein INR49_018794 [Caranx melampygus]
METPGLHPAGGGRRRTTDGAVTCRPTHRCLPGRRRWFVSCRVKQQVKTSGLLVDSTNQPEGEPVGPVTLL